MFLNYLLLFILVHPTTEFLEYIQPLLMSFYISVTLFFNSLIERHHRINFFLPISSHYAIHDQKFSYQFDHIEQLFPSD